MPETGETREASKLPPWLNMDQGDHMDTPIEATVTGEIPSWLGGSLYRNGAGLFRLGETAWNHLFDGFAVMQRWSFHHGAVTFQASVLDTQDYRKSAARNRIVGDGMGRTFPDPCWTLFQRFLNHYVPRPPGIPDNTNVNTVEFGDRLFALTETRILNEVSPESLAVKGGYNIGDHVAVHLSTAHPHKLRDGTMIFYGTNMNPKRAYNFISVPPQPVSSDKPLSGARVVATAPSRWKLNISYAHSFGLTENFFVHLEQPLALSLVTAALAKPLGKSIADFFVNHEGEPLDILLLDRTTGKRRPITYRADSACVFHFINCYEEAGHVVCDVCLWPRGAGLIKALYLDTLSGKINSDSCDNIGLGNSIFARFVLPLNVDAAEEGLNLVTLPNTTATAVLQTGSKNIVLVTPETIQEDLVAETPQINYDFNAVKYRYCYSSTTLHSTEHKLSKFDLVEKRVLTYDVGKDHRAGEPVFVARPGATREDDGVILSNVMADRPGVPSYLAVLDATTFQELGRASLPPEVRMTLTFHGIFTDKFQRAS